jgi:hypothetical protein
MSRTTEPPRAGDASDARGTEASAPIPAEPPAHLIPNPIAALAGEPPPAPLLEIRNQTEFRIAIGTRAEPRRRVLHFPPWGSRVLREDECDGLDLQSWRSRSIIATDRVEVLPPLSSLIARGFALGVFGVGIYAVLIWGIWELVGTPPARYWSFISQLMLVVGLAAMLFQLHGAGRLREVARYLYRRLTVSVSAVFALVALLIAFGLPVAALLAAEGCCAVAGSASTGIARLFEWLGARFAERAPAATGQALQLAFIGAVAVLPALLYFLFDRRKLSSLRDRFFRSVVLLDPNIRTLEDAKSVYGARADEMLGRPDEAGVAQPRPTRLLVILLTTLVVAIGWVAALGLVADDNARTSLHQYLAPARSPVVFAFLGAYVFAIGMLFRRYVRSDLKPEAYAHVVMRIFVAVVVGWVAAELPLLAPDEAADPSGSLLATAFAIGFFPDTWITWIREWAQSRIPLKTSRVSDGYPLELLDGVNLYHRSRLMDEGVDNVENLAHADLVDLMLNTRIPLETLLDWVDQSILVLHTAPRVEPEPGSEPTPLQVLRDHGIRRATDLERAWRRAEERKEADAFLLLLGRVEGGPWKVRVILDALGDDPWMPQLRRCRRPTHTTRVFSFELLRWWDLGERAFLRALRRADDQEKQEIAMLVPPLAKRPPVAAAPVGGRGSAGV